MFLQTDLRKNFWLERVIRSSRTRHVGAILNDSLWNSDNLIYQITMARVTLPIDDMVTILWYIIYLSVHLMIDYIFFSYGTFYCNILCYTTKFTKAFSLKDSYQLISRTLIRISSFWSSKLEWNLNNVVASSWLYSIKPLWYSVSSALDFHIRQVM